MEALTIDFDKYANMSRKQLINALDDAEKKERKIKETYEQNLSMTLQLKAFLKSKIKESLNEPKYYNAKETPIFKELNREIENDPETAKLAEQARLENEKEMQEYQNGNSN
ncbi:hypothetical protein [Campylobacter sp. MIT 97-5078]|uniref:hypothetical protein n=1 Tax=Campylobacter sp. MIT 97-5078 TaxID=1548153 RepID=UPI000512CB75|nr:hypothetical protein [Campylobacter sp. MIT 97-5078]KGI56955.1 hypothetical protein LR59_03715 [Campylobacter sp. MIT 97-5078]TQR22878.1 hypothetical protein DMB91_08570 [Campylobacter sp. MIT 97-5078]